MPSLPAYEQTNKQFEKQYLVTKEKKNKQIVNLSNGFYSKNQKKKKARIMFPIYVCVSLQYLTVIFCEL